MLHAFQCPQCGSHTVVDVAQPEVTCGNCGTTSAQEVKAPMYRPPPPPPQARQMSRPEAELPSVEVDMNARFAQPPPPPPPRRQVAAPPPPQFVTPTAGAGARKGAAFAALIVFGVLGAGVWAAVRSSKQDESIEAVGGRPGATKAAAVRPVGPLRWRQGGPPVVADDGNRLLYIGRVDHGGIGVAAFTTTGELAWESPQARATSKMIPVGHKLLVERDDGTVMALELATGAHRGDVSSGDQLAIDCGIDEFTENPDLALANCLNNVPTAKPLPQLHRVGDGGLTPSVRRVDVEVFIEMDDFVLAEGKDRGDRDQVLVLRRGRDKILWRVRAPYRESPVPPSAQLRDNAILYVVHAPEQGQIIKIDLADGAFLWTAAAGDPNDPYEATYMLGDRLFALTRDRLVVIDADSGDLIRIGD